ncbi:MerR family transcriptional regulator [Saccharothrix sp. ALI-22-I]|uniref:MerR family transcriptional regulator n=1 Tax=Saccharothrix sp. ALI-22-I TaxID=1933778 RepID=UPI00097CB093|nr:MerR family transcriptional regulator [Saccharothrix sp. ALI-22-I]ONI85047.1 MerR family transcriptional regulator [Saccharothrix sp. ALI-22-I]
MVTGDTLLGIGDLARLTGVPVRTIRFYCDEGILESRRSAGGHRRFDRAAVERLETVRRLRGLGLGLPAIADVLAGRRSLDDVVAAERAALDVSLAGLAWRRASLRAVEHAASPAVRDARLALLAGAQDGRAVRESLTSFWTRCYLGPAPPETVEMFLHVSAPPPPADPTPAQVLAYAEMAVLTADRSLRHRLSTRERVPDQRALHDGVGRACELARPLVSAGRAPEPGPALDLFVASYAAVWGTRDTPAYRRVLRGQTEVDRDPRLRRYWQLVATVTGEAVTVGVAHSWLLDALTS